MTDIYPALSVQSQTDHHIKQEINRLRWNQCLVFIVTFNIYSAAHATRQAFANSKTEMEEEWEFKKSFMGILDTSFLVFYSVGLFCSGYIADKYPAVNVLCVGLMGASLTIFIFAISIPWFGIPKNEYWWFILIWSVNGGCQSVGFPTSLKLMANWWTSEGGNGHSGLVFGVWSACQMFGNILGAECVSILNSKNVSVEWMLLVPAFNLAIATIILYLLVKEHPRDIGLSLRLLQYGHSARQDIDMSRDRSASVPLAMLKYEVSDRKQSCFGVETLNQPFLNEELNQIDKFERDNRNSVSSYEPANHPGYIATPEESTENVVSLSEQLENNADGNVTVERKNLGIIGALMIPGCIEFCCCYFCLKGVNYSLYFWLSYFLVNANDFHENAANDMETVYNASQILGGWIIGWLSDDVFLNFRSVPVFLALAVSTVPIFLLRVPSHSQVYVGFLSALAGFTIGGAVNTVSSVVASDLGNHPTLGHNAAAMGTVTGLIDGSGSIGAAICQLAIALIPSWKSVFILLTLLLLTSCLSLSKVFYNDLRSWFKQRNSDQ